MDVFTTTSIFIIDSNPIHCVEGIIFVVLMRPSSIMITTSHAVACFWGWNSKVVMFWFHSGKTLLPLEIQGGLYNFDFLRMQQINLYFENWRSIAWTWIDVKGNHFFPKRFIVESLSIDNIIIQDVANNKGKGEI